MPSTFHVQPVKKIETEFAVPGDKSISHRALMLASLAEGQTRLSGFLPGEDCLHTLRALQALGVVIDQIDETTLLVSGSGGVLHPVCEPLECGSSSTTMCLLAGALVAQPLRTRLLGDQSLSRRSMLPLLEPLQKMGAQAQLLGPDGCPPLEIRGGPLRGIEHTLPMATAQIKTAVLIAGLFAPGTTTIVQSAPTRDHTERLLEHFFAPVTTEGDQVRVRGGTVLHGNDLEIPGDFSSAAFWIGAAAAMPQAQLTIRNVGLNSTRTGLLQILLRMGANLHESIHTDTWEPRGVVRIHGRQLRATEISGEEVQHVMDELPILAVVAALAEGTTIIRNAADLRSKETDRIHAMAVNLAAFGVPIQEREDGWEIQGRTPLTGARVSSFGDHRIAMACAMMGMFAKGATVIDDVKCVASSYPNFAEDWKQVTGQSLRTGKLPLLSVLHS